MQCPAAFNLWLSTGRFVAAGRRPKCGRALRGLGQTSTTSSWTAPMRPRCLVLWPSPRLVACCLTGARGDAPPNCPPPVGLWKRASIPVTSTPACALDNAAEPWVHPRSAKALHRNHLMWGVVVVTVAERATALQ